MTFIDYFVHGHGRGHASRAASVVPRLREDGHMVRVHAGGDAGDLLEGVAPRVPVLPGWRMPWALASRTAGDLYRFGRRAPGLVVSDGDQAALAAAWMRGIPSIAVGHDLVFTSCRLPPVLPTASRWYQRVNGSIPTSLPTARVAVHFLPVEPMTPDVHVARPDLPTDLRGDVRDEGFVLGYFYDRRGRAVVHALARAGLPVEAYGAVGDDGEQRFEQGSFRDKLRRCAAVASSAGSNVLAECVLLGKPVLAVYDRGHHEQALNAALVERAGVGLGARYDDFESPDGDALAATFVTRLRRGEFERPDLTATLPPVSEVVAELARDLLG
jgi:UDP-N-acetylglucosamine--N-acetylmuramyl-(pentapeptide) pyrophosphoryl-undecaprenol N-acetylglucosamine transferase